MLVNFLVMGNLLNNPIALYLFASQIRVSLLHDDKYTHPYHLISYFYLSQTMLSWVWYLASKDILVNSLCVSIISTKLSGINTVTAKIVYYSKLKLVGCLKQKYKK